VTAAPSLTGSVRVLLPLRTKSMLNGSQGFSRGAAMAAARLRKQQRGLVKLKLVTPVFLSDVWLSEGVVVMLTRIAPSDGLDDDNLRAALKSCRDGVADALGCDDRDPRVEWRYGQRRGKAKDPELARGYGVEVVVERRAG